MQNKKLTTVATFLLLLAGSVSLSADAGESAGSIPWAESFAPALQRSEQDVKPLLVDVWAIWCAPCKEMDETTYRDARVIEEAAGFVSLKVDADVATSFIERYHVDVFPTLLFLDSRGSEITRWQGAITAEPLTRLMKLVGSGYAAYRNAVEREQDSEASCIVADYLTAAGNAPGAVTHLQKSLKALKRSEPTAREALEMHLGNSQVAAGEWKTACKTYQRLADQAVQPEIRGKALVGLVRAERERGREAQAAAALERLRTEFPGLAEEDGL